MSKEASIARFWGLDLLRALAIFLVLLAHASFFPYDWTGLDHIFHWFGVLGVELFFALSGFLIGRILLKIFMQDYSFKQLRRFWIRRWLRTLPNYYFILVFNFVLLLIINEFSSQHLLYIGFLQNLWTAHPDFFREAWSLSVEEWFYFLIPLYLLFVTIQNKNKVPQKLFKDSLIYLLVGIQICRLIYVICSPQLNVESDLRQIVIWRLDAPLWGVLAAWFYHFRQDWWRKQAKSIFFIGCLLLIIGICCWYSAHYLAKTFLFPLIDLSFALWLPLATQWEMPKNFIGKTVQHISLISYSLYLIHMQLVFRLVLRTTTWLTWWQVWLVYFILSFLLATLIYKYIERPILNWRDQRFKNS